MVQTMKHMPNSDNEVQWGRRPGWSRILAAALAALLIAPLVSPLFLGWVVVVANGAESAADFLKGIAAGAFVGMYLGFVFLLTGLAVITLIVVIKFEYWTEQSWLRWCLLALAIDALGGVVFFLFAAGEVDISAIGFILIVTIPSAVAAALALRWILLRGHRNAARNGSAIT